jgi:hydrogenase expression/formation protein HypD
VRYLDEFRNPSITEALRKNIAGVCTRPWTIMEICGGQTRTIIQFGLDQLLPQHIRVLHGPGCPVCVTPVEDIDTAVHLSMNPEIILATFGDMMRVPGSGGSLQDASGRGGAVRVLYSPLDALALAEANPGREIVFFGIGFETSAVVTAAVVHQAAVRKIRNFSLLCCHVRIPPAIRLLLSSETNTVQGFIAPGHVCTVTGSSEYIELAKQFNTPFVITGFEPVDLLQGILILIEILESGTHETRIQYSRSVSPQGSVHGRAILEKIFTPCDKNWRGIGRVPEGGFQMRNSYAAFDARLKFECAIDESGENTSCRMGEVLRGTIKPTDCAAFGRDCRPNHPLGASMVSTEGACAIYYRFRSQTGDHDE